MNQLIQTRRIYIIGAALLALFLGAMDALVMSAAMPTIVTELGGLHLYAWVYSAPFFGSVVYPPYWLFYVAFCFLADLDGKIKNLLKYEQQQRSVDYSLKSSGIRHTGMGSILCLLVV